MIGKDKHRISVTFTKEEMIRAINEANRQGMSIGAYLASLVRDTWKTADRINGNQPVTTNGATD